MEFADSIRAGFLAEIRKIAGDEGGKTKVPLGSVKQFMAKHKGGVADKKFHSWAESKGYNVHSAEAMAYRLAAQASDVMTKGRSKGERPSGVSDKEVKKGVKIEMEHTTDPAVAKKITFDHLKEFKKYNTNLRAMERRMEGEERGKTAQWQYASRA